MKTQEVDGSAILSVEPKTSYEFPPFSHHVLFLLSLAAGITLIAASVSVSLTQHHRLEAPQSL